MEKISICFQIFFGEGDYPQNSTIRKLLHVNYYDETVKYKL